MSKCVFRTDLRQQRVSDALPCVDVAELFYWPAASTVLECVQRLLNADEICMGSSDTRVIRQGPKIVGFVRIIDLCSRHDRMPVTVST
jgi:hypothetical protein